MTTEPIDRELLAYGKHLDLLPQYMRDGMVRYIERGIPPGHFMRAVLTNDLMEALGRADTVNRNALPAYGEYLYNYAPSNCWGSVEQYDQWIKGGGLVGKGVIKPLPGEVVG